MHSVAITNNIFYKKDSLKDFINILAGVLLTLIYPSETIWDVAGFELGPRA